MARRPPPPSETGSSSNDNQRLGGCIAWYRVRAPYCRRAISQCRRLNLNDIFCSTARCPLFGKCHFYATVRSGLPFVTLTQLTLSDRVSVTERIRAIAKQKRIYYTCIVA